MLLQPKNKCKHQHEHKKPKKKIEIEAQESKCFHPCVCMYCISFNEMLCKHRKHAWTNAWFNSTCYHPPPPGHTPGNLQFFSHLGVYSPPPGTQKETIPHPRDSSSTTNTLFCVQNIDGDIYF